MKEAGKRLIGQNDYRNFCKMDVGNGVVTFFRRIDNISFEVLDKEAGVYATVELIVEGSSFLWHQIRCIVGVLFLVGQKKEAPSIIDDLLNIEKYPCKPQYNMGSEIPLVLFDCQYEGVKWIFEPIELEKLIRQMQESWVREQTQATIIKRMIDYLQVELIKTPQSESQKNELNKKGITQPYAVLQGKSQSIHHVKFIDRLKVKSLESRVDHYVKRRRLDSEIYDKLAEGKQLALTLLPKDS